MVFFSNCKINIGLNVTGKRADGYHNLETVFLPLPLYDVVELIDAPEIGITQWGLPIPGAPADNMVVKAWQLLKQDFPTLPPVHFHILKNIPAGAGLGAGSANGAYTLLALNKKFDLALTTTQLMAYALQLGSDCPFFICNTPCFATARGEVLEPLPIDLNACTIIIVNPGIHISTSWAFTQLAPKLPTSSLKNTIRQPIATWKNNISNDFEYAAFKTHPAIAAIKNELYATGACFASMSGSGSTVYGLYKKNAAVPLHFPKEYFVKEITFP